RCSQDNALLVLGSATPDVTHYYKAEKGEYIKLVMDNRIGTGFPDVTVCDMRKEIEQGNRTMFSKPMYEELYGLTKSNGQGILLLNRRGFAEHVSCRSCGFVYKCKHCNLSLTYHKQNSVLKCHYCGYAEYMKPVCPECGSKYIRAFGRGTQKLEDELEKYFPGITVLRMDADTTSAKGAHYRMLKEFGEGRYKLMVGTQMVAKGLDFENVVLVGLIAPDVTLNMPEYKSSERVFRLISQASGRAGRGSKKGNVIVQSYQPEHYAVTNAVANDYDGFWQREIEARKDGYYPPFSRVLRLLFTSAELQSAKAEAENAADIIKKYMADHIDTDVLVSQAPIERLHDKYRWHVVVKYSTANDDAHETLHSAVDEILDMNEFSVVRVAVDFAPVSLL
ncbi:MAG: primosomal protein N', partial [Clostridiales bacterium]|nr:primosomal protein N' [Clostridiales bacterium]